MSRHYTLRLLRHLGAGRRTAQIIFRISGWLTYIKVPRRVYRWDDRKPSGWRWLPCGPAMRLLGLSMQLDWDHWDHWACIHGECEGPPCPECGGTACPYEDDRP